MRKLAEVVALAGVALWPTVATADPLADAKLANAKGDYATELSILQPLADQGVPEAEFLLGYMWMDGNSIGPDIQEALDLYRKAAEKGYTPAEMQLGTMYFDGNGVKQDYAEAAKWLGMAAKQGSATPAPAAPAAKAD